MIKLYEDAIYKFIDNSTCIVLRNHPNSQPLKLTRVSDEVLKLLQNGIAFEQLAVFLAKSNEGISHSSILKVARKLEDANLIYPCLVRSANSTKIQLFTIKVDCFVSKLTKPLRVLPNQYLVFLLLVLWCLSSTYCGVFWGSGNFHMDMQFGWETVAAMFFLLLGYLIVHEAFHAIVCRAIGYPVSFAGIILSKFAFPKFFVDTRLVLFHDNNVERASVAFAGLVADVLFLFLLITLFQFRAFSPPIATGLYCSIIMVFLFGYFNFSPFNSNDFTNSIKMYSRDDLIVKKMSIRNKTEDWSPKRVIFSVYSLVYLATFFLLVLKFTLSYYYFIKKILVV